ncbi:(s)-n-methylcoclaurine 3'-hydroxylase isozyme 2 [Phtheirospermum japonicum]|uniref:(S)-n-methylcoclaurine 3'-hydroxylase isozyme 2 n=1 Tax=Phtheirospermum japonicum TaxID=374723 RepID=A0A830CQN8_9LAMI|nr:(s)-n-methylcoclaurine 3'-hydroxylase isozyme 2 [Phtheirospermum japonicum]
MALALLLFVIPIIFLFLKQVLFRARDQLPPGPNSLYVITYLPQLIYKPHRALQKLAQIYGPLMSFRLGGQLMVVASSPETAKEFCTTHGRMFSGRHLPSVYRNLPGTMHSSIVLAPDCSKSWKHLRSIGQSRLFSPKAVETSAWVRKAKVMELVNRLRSREGEVADLEDLMFATLANIISNALTSRDLFDIEGLAEDDCMDLIDEVIEKTTTLGVVDFLPILKGIDFWIKGKAMDIHEIIKRTWGGIINERKTTGRDNMTSSTQDFLDVVLDAGTYSEDQIGNALIVRTFSFCILLLHIRIPLHEHQDDVIIIHVSFTITLE